MAQFDVHRSRGQSRESIPFVVVVQSSLYDEYNRRVVVPLVKRSSLDSVSGTPRLNPTFVIDNTPVVLHPLEIVSIPTDKLGEWVDSLAKQSDRIIDALDELIARAWG